MRRMRSVVVVLMVGVMSGGCAALGLTLVATGLGVAAGTGTAYTLDGIAYRTFAASIDDTRGAALRTLRRMDMKVESDTKADNGTPESRELVALAGDRKIHIELEKLTWWCPESCGKTEWRNLPVSWKQGTTNRPPTTAATGGLRHGEAYQEGEAAA